MRTVSNWMLAIGAASAMIAGASPSQAQQTIRVGWTIPAEESKRQVFLTCAAWVPEQDRLCFARAREAGNPTSKPVLLHVRKPVQQAAAPK